VVCFVLIQHVYTSTVIAVFPFYTNVLLFEQVEEEEESKEGEEASEVSCVYIRFCLGSEKLTPFFVLHCPTFIFLLLQGEKKKKMKTVTEKYWDWELANETKPIWVS
jgi:hypothetical protein